MSVTRRPRRKDERGLVIIYTALLLVVLMIFAALALDMGMLYNARRNDQNAADTAVLGGAQDLSNGDAAIVNEVKGLASSTLGVALTSAQWNSCGAITDPDPVDTALSGANCITVNSGRTQLQVRIPPRVLGSVFGRAAGVNGYDHTAFAIAGLRSAGFGSVLPFGMPSSAGSGDGYECIKSGSGGTTVEPCGGSESGNFGYVDFGYFGSDEVGTTNDCGNGHQRDRAANNMAVGVDHDLSRLNGPPHNGVEVVDTASCGTIQEPNSMDTMTGNTVSAALNPGMAFGTSFSDGGPGRLARTDPNLFNGSGHTRNVSGTQLDDNALWEFIPTSFPVGASVPSSCHRDVFDAVYAGNLSGLPASVSGLLTPKQRPERMRLLLQRCFTHYNGSDWNANGAIAGIGDPTDCTSATGCTDPVFTRNSSTADSPDLPDIQYTSRFGYVPQLTTDFPNGTAVVHIQTFRAIFLQRLLGSCSSNSCDLDFEPGLGIDKSSSPEDAEALTVFTFPTNMLPNGLAGDNAPYELGRNRFVRLIR